MFGVFPPICESKSESISLQNPCQNHQALYFALQTNQNSGIMVAVNPSLAHQR